MPPNLAIVRAGRRPGHYEIAPAYPMTDDEYEQALEQIMLMPVI
ncbi:MAG TPA: hypothetical protein VMZ71_04440 [Gemmataceae bacterium]|nr:hypothetical protein [Gemmataceae bacterium]